MKRPPPAIGVDRFPRRRPDGGQSTVELAFLLPVVVVLALAVIQVALIGRDRLVLENVAREAARAAVVEPDANTAARSADVAAAVSGAALDPDRLSVELRGGSAPGEHLTAVVVYHPVGGVPLVGRLLGPVELRAEATMRIE